MPSYTREHHVPDEHDRGRMSGSAMAISAGNSRYRDYRRVRAVALEAISWLSQSLPRAFGLVGEDLSNYRTRPHRSLAGDICLDYAVNGSAGESS